MNDGDQNGTAADTFWDILTGTEFSSVEGRRQEGQQGSDYEQTVFLPVRI